MHWTNQRSWRISGSFMTISSAGQITCDDVIHIIFTRRCVSSCVWVCEGLYLSCFADPGIFPIFCIIAWGVHSPAKFLNVRKNWKPWRCPHGTAGLKRNGYRASPTSSANLHPLVFRCLTLADQFPTVHVCPPVRGKRFWLWFPNGWKQAPIPLPSDFPGSRSFPHSLWQRPDAHLRLEHVTSNPQRLTGLLLQSKDREVCWSLGQISIMS